MTTIDFNKVDGRWVAEGISASPNIAIHLEFANPKDNLIIIERSAEGSNYAYCAQMAYNEKVFDKTLVGAVSGLKLRITCANEPSNSGYLA